jgi:hypothetical protein
MKKVLCIYYSQSGQLTKILKNFTQPFEDSPEFEVTYAPIKPVNDYPFPWPGYDFFDTFPESVKKVPCEIKPLEIEHEDFDLIVFAYTVWYIAPSIPANSFLLSDQAKRIFKGKPVITLLGVRNMWVVPQEYVKEKINELGGNLIGNIVLQDRSRNITGIITISYFVFTGKKDRFLGFFPKPGVSEKDINNVSVFGSICKEHILNNSNENLQDDLIKQKAVKINPYLVSLEKTAVRVFKIWSAFISKKGGYGDKKRKNRILLFQIYFPIVIILVAPVKYIFFLIFACFKIKKIKKEIEYYSQVKLSKK